MSNQKHRTGRGRRLVGALGGFLAMVCLLGLLPFAAQGATANLITNGGFETATGFFNPVPTNWNIDNGGSVTLQRSVKYEGSRALKIEASAGNYIVAEDFSVEPGMTYRLSYYVWVETAQTLDFAPFLNDSAYGNTWWQNHVAPSVNAVTDDWKLVQSTVKVPESVGTNNPNCKVQLGFQFFWGSGILYLDNVSMEKLDLSNGETDLDFEGENVDHWQLQAEAADKLTLQYDNTVYHSGSQSMYVVKNSLAESSQVKSNAFTPVQSGKIYEFSFWMCSKNASPTATVAMNLMMYGADGLLKDGTDAIAYGTVAALNGGTERSGWARVVTRARIPDGTAYTAFSFTITRGSAELWVDDISFRMVEDGTNCEVFYDNFHAVDDRGNVGAWKTEGSGSITAENGGKLTLSTEGYMTQTLNCLKKDYTYSVQGNYTAAMNGTVQVRFYDVNGKEYTSLRKSTAIQAGNTQFSLDFTAPSNTYAKLYIGSDQVGTLTVHNVTVYQTGEPAAPKKNYLDADWSTIANRENVQSSVENRNGIPTLIIDGHPTAPIFYQRPDLNSYLQTDAESRIHQSGLNLYITYGGSLYKGGCDPIWLSDGTIDYDAFDAVIYDTLAASEDALVMVNIGMFAPDWWLAQNPDHQAQAHNGSSYIPLDDVSLASERFRQEAGAVLRQLIRHMKEQPYYNRVFGLKITGGQSYEWFCWGTGADQGPDYSPVSQNGFRSYLQKKYGTDAALQAAWGNNMVTFETATAPGWEERCAGTNVYLGDADTGTLSRNMVDWNLWLNEASADSFLYYCQIAKEETDNQIIVGGYNGYLWTNNSYDSQGMAHTAMDRVLDSEYVDWIASPIAYNERLLGQSSTYMTLLDSVQAHGKLYIAELDNRTSLSASYTGSTWDAQMDYQVGQVYTMADTISQLKRDFANALVNGAGLWLYDMRGGWLDDAQIYDIIAQAKAEYEKAVLLQQNTTNEIAVFVGDETYAYLTAENGNMSFQLLEPMLMQQRKHLAAMGAGYDTYAMSSLLEGKVPSHKLNIILSPFEITEEMQTAIDTHLKTNNQVVVWVYLPGISTGTALSLENIQRATGFAIGITEQDTTLQVKISDSGHSLTQGIANLTYGISDSRYVSPLAYIQDTAGVTVLGYNADGSTAGLGIRDMDGWTSVYSAAPCLDVALLRNLMKLAGCHCYSENSGDIVYTSQNYVSLHSATAGNKTIQLPGNYSVYDVFAGEFLSMDTNQITYYHEANDTHIFRLMKANTYTVTASAVSGKGTLSASVTEVSPGSGYSLTATPEYGYEIASVTVNGENADVSDNGTVSLSGVQGNTHIRVAFAKQALIENGDLELGQFGGNVTGSGLSKVTNDDAVHSGSYSLNLNNDGTRDLITATVYPEQSATDRALTVTFWAKAAIGEQPRSLHWGALSFPAGGNVIENYGVIYANAYGTWQQFTLELTLPANADMFQLMLYSTDGGTDMYVDDISIRCAGTEMMVNGGLERGNLSGSFTAMEHTPTLVQAKLTHRGDYAAYLPQGAENTVTATASSLNLTEDTWMEVSFWMYAPDQTANPSYCVTLDGKSQVLQEQLSLPNDETWHYQTVKLLIPVGTDSLDVTVSGSSSGGAVCLDDMQVEILSPEAIEAVDLSYQSIFTDGTWRFTLAEGQTLAHTYYRVPALLDGEEGYIVAEKVSDLICVYPDFFSVYGESIPVSSLVIPKGAVLRAVDPVLGWCDIPGAEPCRTAQAVTVELHAARVNTWNVSLSGDLTANFYVQVPESVRHNAQVVLSVAGKTDSYAIQTASYDSQQQGYAFSVHVAAAQMTDPISVQVIFDGRVLLSKSYTIQQYAQYVLGQESMNKYHPIVKEMLHYGGTAQNYFQYRTDDPADAGITGVGSIPVPTAADTELTVDGQIQGVQYYGATMIFQYKIGLRFYFTYSGNREDISFTVEGTPYTPIEKDGLLYVEIPDIGPQNWEKPVLLTVSRGDESLTVAYSPMNYIVRMNQKGTQTLQALLRAMYNYCIAAKEF